MRKFLVIGLLLLAGTSWGQAIKKIIPCEYVTFYLDGTGTIWYGTGTGSAAVKFSLPSGHTVIDGSGGFNDIWAVDESGNFWTNLSGSWAQITSDTTSASFTNNNRVYTWRNTWITIKNDSSAWYGGEDTFHIYHSGANINMRPTALGSGHKWVKFAMGGPGRIVGLESGGNVWQFTSSTGPTGVKMTTPRGAIDIAASHLDYAIAIIPNAPGNGSQTAGYPYIWGTDWGAWSNTSASYSQPTLVNWSLTAPIKEIAANWNTIHFIDTISRLFGLGFNVQGEVGNGVEFVNRYTYNTFPGYGWDLSDHENPTGTPPIQIGIGVTWKHIWDRNAYFCFHSQYTDVNDSGWSNGRNKSQVLGNGFHNLDEQNSPNALDVLVPTMVHPLTAVYKQYHFTAPNLSVSGGNQSITTTSTTVTAAGHPALLINQSNSTDTLNYRWVTYAWTKISGAACTITTPSSKSTTISGLATGSYVFQVLATDNNSGQDTAKLAITVSVSTTPPTVSAGADSTAILPRDSVHLIGTATGNGGATITSTVWTQVSGPNTAIIRTAGATSTIVTGLIAGTYIFRLSATDSNSNTSSDTVTVIVTNTPSPGCNCLVFPGNINLSTQH